MDQNIIIVFSNSIANVDCNAKFKINHNLINSHARVRNCPGDTSREIFFYLDPTLSEGRYEAPVLCLVVNNILNYHNSINIEELMVNYEKNILELRTYGIRNIISSLVFNTRLNLNLLNKVNKQILRICNDYWYINNDNVIRNDILKDGLLLSHSSRPLLSKNFVMNLNDFPKETRTSSASSVACSTDLKPFSHLTDLDNFHKWRMQYPKSSLIGYFNINSLRNNFFFPRYGSVE